MDEKRELITKANRQDDGRFTIIATTSDVDRDNEIVDPRGVTNLAEYLKQNPVVLWAHDYWSPPIAKAVSGSIFDDRIELAIEFAPTPLGQEIKALYEGGFMNSFSIGFIPKDHKVIGEQWIWTKWEFIEVSAVPVPNNRFATMVRDAEDKGIELAHVKSLYREATAKPLEGTERNAAKNWGGLAARQVERSKYDFQRRVP